MTNIKICGLFREQDIEYVNEALPDYIGFVFAQSRRNVTPAQAERLKVMLDKRIKAVGVFVNADISDVAALALSGVIDLVQLHGDEDAAYIEQLQSRISAPVIKALRARSAAQITHAQSLPCRFLLLDASQGSGYGGSGKTFDWTLIPQLEKPYFLAGGLNAQNIREALSLKPYCVDISSGAETDGIKDREKILQLVGIVRSDNV